MGQKELIESLHKEAEEKIRQLWKDAEAEAEKIRAGTAEKIERAGEEYRKKQSTAVKKREQDILSKAAREARKIRLMTEKALSDRLFPLALSCLEVLKSERYKEVFGSLAKELPNARWKEVRVHPDDLNIAEKHFAASDIAPDSRITGGLEALSADGKTFVNNTFEKRLERAWDDLLPLLIKEIYKEVSEDGTVKDP
jgi:vacuolar-type H+-ATPase subunit E/Vma4